MLSTQSFKDLSFSDSICHHSDCNALHEHNEHNEHNEQHEHNEQDSQKEAKENDPCECDKCESKFSSEGALRRHKKTACKFTINKVPRADHIKLQQTRLKYKIPSVSSVSSVKKSTQKKAV